MSSTMPTPAAPRSGRSDPNSRRAAAAAAAATAARRRRVVLVLAAVAAAGTVAAACGGRGDSRTPAGGATGGTVVIAVPADVDALLPPLVASLQGKQVSDFLYEHLADIGASLSTAGDRDYTPRLADRWEWAKDSMSIAFHLNPRARWHDGVPVRAGDVRFTHQLFVNPVVGSPAAPNVANIDSVSVRDSLTAVFWFKRRSPEQFFDAAYQMPIVPEHLLAKVAPADLRTSELARNPVGSGPFRFVRWTPGSTIELVADTTYYGGRPKLDRVIWTFTPDFTTAVTKLLTGEADIFEPLRPENVAEVAKNPSLRTEPYGALDYGFMAFNLRDHKSARPHPLFGDRALRRALTMAVNRQAIVKNVFDTLGAVALGPYTRAQFTADSTIPQIPFDLDGAKRALDSLGWRDTNGDGYRERNGRPLAFTLLTPTSSKNRVRIAVLLQEQLKAAGVKVDIEQMEFNAFMQREVSRDFDAVMGGWHLDPSPGGVRQQWGTAGSRGKDGSNYSSYESPTFDAYVDSALVATDPAREKALFRRAYETILADAPAVWLYEPRPLIGVHSRLSLPDRHADAWWAGFARWSVAPGKEIPRDRVGLRAATTAAAPTPAAAPAGTPAH
ncbi:MAG TPA: peptide ABC transporter substrate-binding protein [Gemmatimonadaceae bacterium]|nr:peptide ABC transporter substrate-binding protein [Gemmatimonadaceae bacterium]